MNTTNLLAKEALEHIDKLPKEFQLTTYELALYQIEDSPVITVHGPNKSGKSKLLKTLGNVIHAEYYDLRNLTEDDKSWVINRVYKAISSNENTCIILDEITFIPNFDEVLANISDLYKQIKKTHGTLIRMLISSSQYALLNYLKCALFPRKTCYIYVSETYGYRDWKFLNSKDNSTNSFIEYIKECAIYDRLSNLRKFLNYCIDDIEISNNNASKELPYKITPIDRDDLVDISIRIMYSLIGVIDVTNEDIRRFILECRDYIEDIPFNKYLMSLRLLGETKIVIPRSRRSTRSAINWFRDNYDTFNDKSDFTNKVYFAINDYVTYHALKDYTILD